MAIQLISSNGSIITQEIGSCVWDLTIQVDTENNLVYGGVVTWLQDYDFYVSPAGYYLNNVFYESPEAFVTLNPADPTLDRFDVIYVDSDQIVKVLQGVPSDTASQPGLDLGTQLGLGVIFVQAASTQPSTANEECAYVDNAEWVASPSDGSIDVGSTNTPCSGSTSIEGTTVTAGDYFKLTAPLAFALSPDFNNVHFVIRSKGAWGNGKLNIQWFNGGLAVGNAIPFGHGNNYNFASNNTTDCQLITLDATDFALPMSQTVDEIRFTMSGNNNIGFFIDNVCIQNNGSVVLPADNDIHNQYFGPQTPGDWWIAGNNRTHGWITSPDILTGGDGSEKFGWGSRVIGSAGTAIGFLAQANGQEGATAVGNQAVANVGVAIGFGAYSTRGVAIGGYQTGSGGTVVGWGANSNALSAIAIGGNAQANGNSAVSLGYYAFSNGYGSVAIGSGAQALHNFSGAIGVFAETTASSQLVIGGDHLYTDTGFTSMYFGSGVTSPWNANRFWSVTGAEGTNVAGTSWTLAGAPGTGNALSGPIYLQTSDPTGSGTTLQTWSTKVGLNSNTLGFYLDNTRFQTDEGADIAASGDLTLGTGNIFTITGNTTVNAITSTNWQDGAVIYLVFTGIPTLKHDTAGGAGTSRLRLAGAIDFAVTANTVLALLLKDGYWREIGRTQATVGGGGDVSADNGLTMSSLTNVQLGSASVGGAPLLHDTYIGDASPYSILATSTVTGTNSTLISTNTSTGAGLFGAALSGVGSGGSATSGVGGAFRATTGVGLTATSVSSFAGMFTISPATTNTIADIISIARQTTGTAANGIGTSVNFNVQTSAGTIWPSNQIISRWTNATTASRVSEYSITGVDNAITSTLFTLSGNGRTRLNEYGIGTFIDTPIYSLGVDASGNIVEFVGGGGGGSLSANNGLTENVADNVQLGGTLIQTTTVNTGGYQTNWTGTNSGVAILNLFNDGTGPGIVSATTGGGTAGYFTAQGGTAVTGEQGLMGGVFSGSVIGVVAGGTTDSAIPLSVSHTLTTTATAERMISISRGSSGTPAIGIGAYIEYDLESDGSTAHAGRIGYVLTDVTSTFEDSRFDLTVMSGGAMSRAMAIHDTGQMTLDKYGVGNFPDTPAYALGVDASGNVIEFTPGVGGAGFITADNGLNASSLTNVQLGGPLLLNTIIDQGSFSYVHNFGPANEQQFLIDGSGVPEGSAILAHLENTGSTRYMDFQLYHDGLVITQNYDASTIDMYMGNGGAGMAATNGTEDSYVDAGSAGYLYLKGSQAISVDASSFQQALGSPVTSAGDLNVLADGNLFFVTGSTQIDAILSSNWQAGSVIQLLFIAAPLVKHATTGGVGTAPIWLQGSVDFQAAANDIIQLVYDGGEWVELSRTLAGSAGSYTVDNGLSTTTPTNFRLGGTLVTTTDIALSSQTFSITGPGSNKIYFDNAGVDITTNDGTVPIQVQSNASSTFMPTFITNKAATNSVLYGLELRRQTTGTAAAGIGVSLTMSVEDDGGTISSGTTLESKLTTVTAGATTTQFDIVGRNAGSLNTIMSAHGTGVVGVGIASGFGATRLQVVDNALTSSSIAKITSVSTTYANGGRGLDVQLSGSSSGAASLTAGYFSNTRIDATGGNTGVWAVVSGGANDSAVRADHQSSSGYAVQANTATGTAVNGGASSSGQGGIFTSISGQGLQASSVSGLPASIISFKAGTNNVATVLELYRQTSNTAASGIGAGIDTWIEPDSGSFAQLASQVQTIWVDAALATRTAQIDFKVVNSTNPQTIMSAYGTGVVGIGIDSSYGATRLDVYNASTASTPTVRLRGAPSGQSVLEITQSSSGSYGMIIYSNAASSIGAEIQGTNSGVIGRGTHASLGVGVQGNGTAYGGQFINSLTTNGVNKGLAVQSAATTGASGDGVDIDFGMPSTNSTALGTGIIRNRTTTMGTATSTASFDFLLSDGSGLTANAQVLTLSGNGSMTLTPMTATAASAITPAEGMIVIVSTTNGTFTSVGFWGYSGGAWAKF